MSGNPWYKRYPKDFFNGTTKLTFEQKGAYTLCLDLMYQDGGPIPDDPKWISRQLGCSMQLWRKLRQALIDHGKFTLTDDGRLANGRATYEMHMSRAATTAQTDRGKFGGRPKGHAETPSTSHSQQPSSAQEPAEKSQQSSNKLPTKLLLSEDNSSDINELGFTEEKPTQRLRDSESLLLPLPESVSARPREVEEVVLEAWKKTGLPCPRKMTGSRRKKLAARVKEHGLNGVLEAISAIGSSKFCHGQGAHEGWKASIDFLLNEEKCLWAIEGKYADRKSAEPDPHARWFGP